MDRGTTRTLSNTRESPKMLFDLGVTVTNQLFAGDAGFMSRTLCVGQLEPAPTSVDGPEVAQNTR